MDLRAGPVDHRLWARGRHRQTDEDGTGIATALHPGRVIGRYAGTVSVPNDPSDHGDLYDPAAVRELFDEMSDTYERVNLVTSFGFSRRWRRQAVDQLRLQPGETVLDWMTGMGEAWPHILGHVGHEGRIAAVDFSAGMLRGAIRRRARWSSYAIDVVQGDALATGRADASADAIVITFGLKTLSQNEIHRLASEVARVLRPGGRFSLIEVSLPPTRSLRWPYRFYIRRVIPQLGRVLLGDPATYRMLGVYTERFGDCRPLVWPFRDAGLEATFVSYFFGCATGLVGRRSTS